MIRHVVFALTLIGVVGMGAQELEAQRGRRGDAVVPPRARLAPRALLSHARELGLTEEQVSRLRERREAFRDRREELLRENRNRRRTFLEERRERRERAREMRRAHFDAQLDVLTEEQRERLTSLRRRAAAESRMPRRLHRPGARSDRGRAFLRPRPRPGRGWMGPGFFRGRLHRPGPMPRVPRARAGRPGG